MKSPLLKKVEELDDNLKSLRQDAGPKWQALQQAQQAVAEHDGTVNQDHDLFKAMDDAGKAYGEIADQIASTEQTKAGIIASLAHQGIVDPTALHAAGAGRAGEPDRRSAGQRIAQAPEYLAAREAGDLTRSSYSGPVHLGEAMSRDELKAALVTGAADASAGSFITPDRQGYYPMFFRPLTVLDLITIGQTNSDLVEFVRMLTFTNAAAETPEAVSGSPIGDGTGGTVTAVQGGVKPQSDLGFEVVQEGVKTIAHWVAATKRALADAGQLATIIDGALRWGLGDRLERQIVAGNGVGENLRGILNTTGLNTIPSGTTSRADKIHKGITQVRLDGFEPTGVVLNPLDAEAIRLSRENTGGAGTGAYLFGPPSQAGQMTLWGLPVAQSPSIPQGTGLVGQMRAAIFWLREGTQVLASDSHADWFTRNLVAVLAEMRGGFGIPTPQALAEVDFTSSTV